MHRHAALYARINPLTIRDMISAAQSFNLDLQTILDENKGYGDESKLNSLALVKLVFELRKDVDLQ